MRNLIAVMSVAGSLALATPVTAAIVGDANIDFADQPFTFGFGGNSFTLSFQPEGDFDFDPTFLQTTGTAQATAFGGFLGIPLQPSTFFTSANIEVGPNTFPGFAAFPDSTVVPFSISSGDLGLRVTVGQDNFYGYVRFAGSLIDSYAFETTANTPITAGSFVAAVPEPATWTMFIVGFGLAGAAMRARRRTKDNAVA